MSSKRSFQDREEEPWLRYPDTQTTSRRYSAASYYKHQPTASFDPNRLEQHSLQVHSIPQPQPHQATAETASPLSTPTMRHKRTISRIDASSSSSYQHHEPAMDHSLRFHHTNYRSSRRGPQPRTLSEELSMALQQNPEDNYPSPTTPSALLSSPADMSMLSSPASSSSTFSSTGHFPLFKPSLSDPHDTIGSGGQPKPKPSPLSLNYSNSHGPEGVAGGNPSFPLRSGSPTFALSRDTTIAGDIAGSPRAAFAAMAANLGSSSSLPRSNLHHSRGTMSPAASTSDASYSSSAPSPRASTAPCSTLCYRRSSSSYHQHHSSCLHSQSDHHHHIQHHPACQHHTALPSSQQESPLQHGPKPGRATKGINRFGMPQFRPEMDDSHPGSSERYTPMKTTSTSTSGLGYGMQRNRDDDDEDMDGLGPSYALEPPKKRQRSMSSMLLDAAVETVIFTGAVALSAYQLLTGKSMLGSHSKQSLIASEDANAIVREENAKMLEEDPMEEKLSLQLNTTTTTSARATRPYGSAGTLGRSRVSGYKAKTPRSYRSRQSYASAGSSTRIPPMPVRPNTGTEDTDETFLRMEAQLNSLIAEGKRALNSRVEVWDEEYEE